MGVLDSLDSLAREAFFVQPEPFVVARGVGLETSGTGGSGASGIDVSRLGLTAVALAALPPTSVELGTNLALSALGLLATA